MPVACLALLVFALGGQQPSGSASVHEIADQAARARQANRAGEAIALYRRALAAQPDWGEGWWLLGTLYYQEDRYAECRDSLRRLVALDAKAGPAWAILGLCEYRTRDHEMALVHLREAQRLGFGATQIADVAQYHLAILLARYEDFEDSLAIWTRLAKAGAEDPAMIGAAGIAALRKPLLPEQVPAPERELILLAGRAVWKAAAETPVHARGDFEALAERYPGAPGVHYLYGSYLLTIGESDAGMEQLKQELKISPRHVPARVQLALEYLKRREPAGALAYAREAARVAPGVRGVRVALGRALAETGDLAGAIEELEALVQDAPDFLDGHVWLATLYYRQQRKQDGDRERETVRRLSASGQNPN